jgi:hypothetical protein
MAEEVTTIVNVAMGPDGLIVQIPSNDYMLLWGIAKLIEKRADEVQFQTMSMAAAKTKRLVVAK